MQLRQFRPGDALLRQGDPGDHLLVLVEGEADVIVTLPDERRNRVHIVKRGDVVGEMALLSGEPRDADVVARNGVLALLLPALAFEKLAQRHLELTVLLTALVEDRLEQKCLEGYRIRRTLGRGAMGVVYEAVREGSDERRALKMIGHRLAHDMDALARFEREAEIAESLDSDHVIRVFGRFSSHRTYFLIMELCDGPALDDVIRVNGAIPEAQVRAVVGQMAKGLVHIHSRGHLHRDIKPANVLLTRAGAVKLADLGLARPISDSNLTAAGTVVGTPAYMAPEQLGGKSLSEGVDLYATGCVAYELLTGRRLFDDNALAVLAERKRDFVLPEREKILPDLSEELYAFLRLSLQIEPDQRSVCLESVGGWAKPLDAELISRTVESMQSSAPEDSSTAIMSSSDRGEEESS